VPAAQVAKWNGSSWSALADGVGGSVWAIAWHDDGREDTAPPTLSHPAAVIAIDVLGSPPGEVVSFSVSATDLGDPAPSVACVPSSGSFFPRGTTLVTCTATDACGNQSAGQFPVTVQIKARRR
jgi:hypothetical protein